MNGQFYSIIVRFGKQVLAILFYMYAIIQAQVKNSSSLSQVRLKIFTHTSWWTKQRKSFGYSSVDKNIDGEIRSTKRLLYERRTRTGEADYISVLLAKNMIKNIETTICRI